VPIALVTGASGFVGPYLVRHLLEQGREVVGSVHNARVKLPSGSSQMRLDVTDRKAVQKVVAEVRPGEIYHLAGLTYPASRTVEEFYRVNFNGALNLLETVREQVPESKVLLVGSAYAYGKLDHPITETECLNPLNHYGVSKASADLLGCSYALQGLNIVRARPFNHTGPNQRPDFVLPTLVRQFAEIRAGRSDPIVHLGNLDSIRDYSDVRDIVRGYYLALQNGRNGEAYNFGSGRGISVRELYEMVCRTTRVKVHLKTELSKVRATDIPYLVADVSKSYRELGWKAEIPLKHTIQKMLEALQSRALLLAPESEAQPGGLT
jgi:GDP-4-dehydro-6-deoxy-D-mannose reductase